MYTSDLTPNLVRRFIELRNLRWMTSAPERAANSLGANIPSEL